MSKRNGQCGFVALWMFVSLVAAALQVGRIRGWELAKVAMEELALFWAGNDQLDS
jgi:hypothetical protein